MQPPYKAIFKINGETFELFEPFAEGATPAVGFATEKGQNFYTKDINFNIRFCEKEQPLLYEKLKDLFFHGANKCLKIEVETFKFCKGEYKPLFDGFFLVNELTVECYSCEISAALTENSKYTQAFSNWEREVCFFVAPTQTVCGGFDGIEYEESKSVSTWIIDPLTVDQQLPYLLTLPKYLSLESFASQAIGLEPIENNCVGAYSGNGAPITIQLQPKHWGVCSTKTTIGYNAQGETLVVVTTIWGKETLTTNCVNGAPVYPVSNLPTETANGWYLLQDNCSTNGTADFARKSCTNGKQLPDFGECRRFADMMNIIANALCPGACFCSLFFGENINGLDQPTGQAALDVLAASQVYDCLMISEFTDILRADESGITPAGESRFCKEPKLLLEELNALFLNTLEWWFDETTDPVTGQTKPCLRIEHISYIEDKKNVKPFRDFFATDEKYRDEIFHTAKFALDTGNIPNAEIFGYSLENFVGPNFAPLELYYGDFCGNGNTDTTEYKCFQNDVVSICRPAFVTDSDGNTIRNPDKIPSIDRGTFVLMAVVKDAAGKAYLDANNQALTPNYIFENFGKWCRYLPALHVGQAALDAGEITPMLHTLPVGIIDSMLILNCCPNTFDPTCLYDIDFECGPSGPFVVDSFTFDDISNCSRVDFSYSCPLTSESFERKRTELSFNFEQQKNGNLLVTLNPID